MADATDGSDTSNGRGRRPVGRVVLFAVAVALVAGTVVSLVSVALQPRQAENLRRERESVLLGVLRQQPSVVALLDELGAGALRADLVFLATGCPDPDAPAAVVDAASAPGTAAAASHASVFSVADAQGLALLVLPVAGSGYQSLLQGYLVLHGDLRTVAALAFYAQDETPGMGGRIAEPGWPGRWQGKRLRDDAGRLRIGVRVRGEGDDASPFRIDAMTGATYTAAGINRLLADWLGDDGYGPLLGNLRTGADCVSGIAGPDAE